jgi:hypothetical protein
MKNYTAVEIESLIKRFEARTLPEVEWTHEAHLVVAIWYDRRHDFAIALPLVRDYISHHNESVGNQNTETEGYHESITKFWMVIASAFLKENEFNSDESACNAFINSDFGTSKFPLEFYSESRLFSVEARMNWVMPDLKELPAFSEA